METFRVGSSGGGRDMRFGEEMGKCVVYRKGSRLNKGRI